MHHLNSHLILAFYRWQKLRTTELTFEKELKDNELVRLTNLERSLRKRIEDILDPQPLKAASAKPPSKANHQTNDIAVNGTPMALNGDTKKKGKKKND